jgi:hypothetical protein
MYHSDRQMNTLLKCSLCKIRSGAAYSTPERLTQATTNIHDRDLGINSACFHRPSTCQVVQGLFRYVEPIIIVVDSEDKDGL